MVEKGNDGFYHPANEDELRWLIEKANREGVKIRVRGAAHSVNAAIYTGDYEQPPRNERHINVYLDKMARVSIDKDARQVTVQAGCHLGKDPGDPARVSTIENSLFYQITEAGLAFPDTGGIIHQTVAGFLMTGSSGGSVQHSVGDAIVKLRFIDGTGTVHEVTEASHPGAFYAAGVSVGLLGIVTEVTFQLQDRYNVVGEESTTRTGDCKVDLFGTGTAARPSLEQYVRQTEHSRLLWWPQKGVDKVILWEGRKIPHEPDFKPKPYLQFPIILGSNRPAQFFASTVYHCIRYWNTDGLLGKLTRAFLKVALAPIINSFQPADGKKGPKTFQDVWWKTLPMDNTASDKLLPTEFTEMWVPLEQTHIAMQKLRDHFAQGFSATGPYLCEIYAAKSSRFWMSPAFGRDVIKIDMFWFGKNKTDPVLSFYPQFWELLKDCDFRMHWGKYLAFDPKRPTLWLDYLRARFPHWNDFMQLREQMDPNQVFVTDYWAKHLGIQRVGEPVAGGV